MSAWRREALRCLPHYAKLIVQSNTCRDLWRELWFEFEDAYREEPRNEAIIAGTYEFAFWCWHGSNMRGNDIGLITDVFGQFFEPLPQDNIRREDMPRWLCLREFEVLQAGPFAYFLNSDEHERMVRDFRKAKAKQPERDLPRCSQLKLIMPK